MLSASLKKKFLSVSATCIQHRLFYLVRIFSFVANFYGTKILRVWNSKHIFGIFITCLTSRLLCLYIRIHLCCLPERCVYPLLAKTKHLTACCVHVYEFQSLKALTRQNTKLLMCSYFHECIRVRFKEGRKEMFYLTTHSTHFIYGYMASDIWLRTILIVRKETHCRHMGYSYRLTARVLLYAPSHRQDSTYHSLCYTSRGALAGTRNSSMGPPHEGSTRRPIAP